MQQSGLGVTARLSVMMFIEFYIWGAWYVTMAPYMDQVGLGDLKGWAYSLGPIAAIVSPFFLGMVADRFFATERVLGVMHLLGGAALCLAPTAAQQSGTAFLAVILIHMLLFMPTLGLTNTLALHNMTDAEKQFPMVRVFGTIGWIVANLTVSWGFKADTEPTQFYIAGVAAIALGIYSFALPHTPAPAKGQKTSVRQILGLDSLRLLKERSFLVFIVCSFLICIPLATYYGWGGSFAGSDVMGLERVAFYMSFGQMSEIFFMLLMPLAFARFGVKWMLLIGMAAWVARYGLFAGAAGEGVFWMFMAGVVLHGICYDFFFVTGQIYVDKKSDRAIRGQAQGFLVLVTQGLGMLIGAQLMGRVQGMLTSEDGALDWTTFWLIPCIMAAVIMVVFFVLFRDRTADPDETPGIEQTMPPAVEREAPTSGGAV